MDKLKLFLENFMVYGLGGIINKLIPLIMLPVVTRMMPDASYFGVSDLSNTVVQFGSAVAVMGMYDAMYRMFFEKDDIGYKKMICSTALMFTMVTSGIIFIIMLVCRNLIAQYFFGNRQYAYIVYLSAMATLVGATNSIIAAPTRMENRRKVFLVTNLLSSVLSYSISIPLLLTGHYLIALPLASVLSGMVIEVTFGLLNYSWFDLRKFDKRALKQMLVIAVPLMPNFLIYWVFNSCDKVMIANMLGVGAEGIYSVGSKLGHCSQLIYTAFAGGWQYFAFSTMHEENQVELNSKIFEYLGIISFIATVFICAWSYPLFGVLFTENYQSGYIVAPYLFLAPLLQMLFQVACNQFLVIKNTWPNMLILSCGAVINVAANYFLIPLVGIEGAAAATLMGYVVSDVVCVGVLCKVHLMTVSGKFIVVCGMMFLAMIIWRIFLYSSPIVGTFFAILLGCIFAILYKSDIQKLVSAIRDSCTKS